MNKITQSAVTLSFEEVLKIGDHTFGTLELHHNRMTRSLAEILANDVKAALIVADLKRFEKGNVFFDKIIFCHHSAKVNWSLSSDFFRPFLFRYRSESLWNTQNRSVAEQWFGNLCCRRWTLSNEDNDQSKANKTLGTKKTSFSNSQPFSERQRFRCKPRSYAFTLQQIQMSNTKVYIEWNVIGRPKWHLSQENRKRKPIEETCIV